jgi:hypothetical protein
LGIGTVGLIAGSRFLPYHFLQSWSGPDRIPANLCDFPVTTTNPHSTRADQWAGAVFALLVVVPAAILPKLAEPKLLLDLRYSPWIIVPILGGTLAGWIMRPRTALAGFGALAGFSGFWCASTWGAGSKATSVYEALAATGVGVLPVFVLYALYKRFNKARHAFPADR